MSFIDDIQGQNTQLYPIVEIDGQFYSTNNVTIGETYCKPILMNIPSIKESIDVESRKFKISNVSLQFNNFPFEGVRFSDQLSEASLINTEATIYFKSPSTNTVEEMHEAYRGIIRRISHDDEKVKVELEDLTEQKAHKDLPQALDENGVVGVLGTGESVPDKYKNKAIPMVYGHVDKSPVVISENFNKYQADSRTINQFLEVDSEYDLGNGSGIYLDSLQVDIGGEVLHVKRGSQYEYGDNSIDLLSGVLLEDEFDEFSMTCRKIANPRFKITNPYHANALGMDLINEDFLEPAYTVDNINAITDGILDTNNIGLNGEREINHDENYLIIRYNAEHLLLALDFDVTPQHDTVDGNNKIIGFRVNGYNLPNLLGDRIIKIIHYNSLNGSGWGDQNSMSDQHDSDYDMIWRADCPHNDIIQQVFGFTEYAGGATSSPQLSPPAGYDGSNAAIELKFFNNTGDFTGYTAEVEKFMPLILFSGGVNNSFSIQFRVDSNIQYPSYSQYNPTLELSGHIDEIGLLVESESTKLFNNDFYANVEGRINTFNDHPELSDEVLIQNPIDIIYDLVRSELGHHDIDEDEYLETKAEHPDWTFGFTISKKTNSKKLIQEIAKSTKCFPKFKNDGTFGFNTIKDSYTVIDDYHPATLIKESEVISYSFKKTKPRQIYQKVTVSYNKDYAQDSYLKTSDPIEQAPSIGDYYGIEDSSDAHLEFESDYIRHDETANKLASFLSEQYKNDHLIFNLKLPLQYIDLEIGDLVKFRELFNGVKAYGIDYRGYEHKNDQLFYPLFIVTATTKNLDSVAIECMQLHHLSPKLEFDGFSEAVLDNNYTVGFFDVLEGGLFYFPDSEPLVLEPYEPVEEPFEGESWVIPVGSFELGWSDDSFIEFLYSWGGSPENSNYIFDWTVDEGLVSLFNTPNEVGNPRRIRIEVEGSDLYANYEIVGGVNPIITNDNNADFSLNLHFLDSYSGEDPIRNEVFTANNNIIITEISFESTMLMGDVNLDNTMNVLDVVAIVGWILGSGEIQAEYNADTNEDGNVNVLDIVKMVNCILGTGSCDFG